MRRVSGQQGCRFLINIVLGFESMEHGLYESCTNAQQYSNTLTDRLAANRDLFYCFLKIEWSRRVTIWNLYSGQWRGCRSKMSGCSEAVDVCTFTVPVMLYAYGTPNF